MPRCVETTVQHHYWTEWMHFVDPSSGNCWGTINAHFNAFSPAIDVRRSAVYQSSIALFARIAIYLRATRTPIARPPLGLGSYLRGGHRLPSRVGVWSYLRLLVRVQPTGHKVGFEFRQREIFPFLSLGQERAALRGTEGRCLTV